MEKTDVKFGGSPEKIYSGAYLIGVGYNRAFEEGSETTIELAECHLRRKRYLAKFPEEQQYSEKITFWHHTSDIHGVVEEQMVTTNLRQKGMFYIGIDNTDYYPHPRTDIRRSHSTKEDFERGPNAPDKFKKIIGIIGHRPFGNSNNYNINDKDRYGMARRFFEAVFDKAKSKYSSDEIAVLTTGCIGYAQLAEEIAIEKGISVWLHIPFKDFHSIWSQREQDLFLSLSKQAFKTDLAYGETFTSKSDRIKAIRKANFYIADRCDQLITVYDGKRVDEVADTLLYAKKKKLHVTNFFPNKKGQLKDLIQDNYIIEGVHPYERFVTKVIGPNF